MGEKRGDNTEEAEDPSPKNSRTEDDISEIEKKGV